MRSNPLSEKTSIEVTTDPVDDILTLRFRMTRSFRHEMSLRQIGDYEFGLALLLSSLRPDSDYEDDDDAMADPIERAEIVMSDHQFRRLRQFQEDR